MRHQFRNQWGHGEPRDFFEKAFRRDSLAVWDARWQGLSVPARRFFLDVVKLSGSVPSTYSDPASVATDKFPPDVLEELAAAQFVQVRRDRFSKDVDLVIAGFGVDDFAWRARILRRLHLLDADRPSEFSRYVDEVFSGHELAIAVSRVLREVGVEGYVRLDEGLPRFVIQHRWHEWVSKFLGNPLVTSILGVVREIGGAIPLSELSGRIEGTEPELVRGALDALIAHLALVEDLHPETLELMVGLLPAVREKIKRACQPRERPPLVVCDPPKEVAPHGSALVSDLRAILLELANGPPRIRNDHGLHQRQIERFLAVLEPLPGWLLDALDWTAEWRLYQALAWASVLKLVKHVSDGRQTQLHLNAQGHRWLASDLEEQYTGIFDLLTRISIPHDLSEVRRAFYDPTWEFARQLGDMGARFFGEKIIVQRVETPGSRRLKVTGIQAGGISRPCVSMSTGRLCSASKLGVFYELGEPQVVPCLHGAQPPEYRAAARSSR